MEVKRLGKEEKGSLKNAGKDSESTTRQRINSQLKHFERSLNDVDRQAILKTKQFILGNKNAQTVKSKAEEEAPKDWSKIGGRQTQISVP